jgi:hypothetical protein
MAAIAIARSSHTLFLVFPLIVAITYRRIAILFNDSPTMGCVRFSVHISRAGEPGFIASDQ